MRSAKYWVAKFVPDLFRDEPRNVGVVVELDGDRAAKFDGELRPGQIDMRTSKRKIANLSAYQQWIAYWRHKLDDNFEEAINPKRRDNYFLVSGGEVHDIGDDPIDFIVEHLFYLMVESDVIEDEIEDSIDVPRRLDVAVRESFKAAKLLASPSGNEELIRPGVRVKGLKNYHYPQYAQKNGNLCIIEIIDFVHKRRLSLQHAGLTAYVFRDISDLNNSTERFSLVQARPEDKESNEYDYGVKILMNEGEVVDWLNERQRADFLAHRAQAANHLL